MLKKTIFQLTEMIDVTNDISNYRETVVNGVCIDTRKLEKGNLFIPFVGEHVDGHDFVVNALENGASASLWQKDVPNPPLHLPIIIVEDTLQAVQQLAKAYRNELNVTVIGVTGSNGKTTTKDIIYDVLSRKYKVQKTEGNFNNHLGLPLTILQLKEDTEFAILEMGMSGKGEISLLTKIARPDTVIITNVGESHLLHLGSRKAIADAKYEIVEGLADDGLIVYFGDEPLLEELFSQHDHKATVKTFGYNNDNNIYLTNFEPTEAGYNFTTNLCEKEFSLPILGKHNLLNALAAMLVANYYDLSYEEIKDGFKRVQLTNMRMELVEGLRGEKIINDAYNASPTSMLAAIELLAELPNFDVKMVVLGDILELGEEEEAYHYNIGEKLDHNKIDYVFTYGKLAQKIAEAALVKYDKSKVFSFTNKDELVNKLKSIVKGNEIILFKGSRGMKLEDVIASLVK